MGTLSGQGRFSLVQTFWPQTESKQLEENCNREARRFSAERPKGRGSGLGAAKDREQSSPSAPFALISWHKPKPLMGVQRYKTTVADSNALVER